MADLSPAYADRVATWLLRPGQAAPSRPTGLFVGLFVGASEVSTSGTGYARVEIDDADLDGPTGGDGTVTVDAVVAFPSPTGLWGNIDGAALFDQAGTRITEVKALPAPYPVDNGDPAPSFAAGELTFVVA